MSRKLPLLTVLLTCLCLCKSAKAAGGPDTYALDIGVQGELFLPPWGLEDIDRAGAVGPTANISLQWDWSGIGSGLGMGPFLRGGFLYVNGDYTLGTAQEDDVRIVPLGALGYSIYIHPSRYHGVLLSAANLLSSGGFGGEAAIMYQMRAPEWLKIFIGLTGGYIQTGVTPDGADEMNFGFIGFSLGANSSIPID